MAFVLGVNKLMIKKTVLKLEVENTNLKEFTIFTRSKPERLIQWIHIEQLLWAQSAETEDLGLNQVDNELYKGGPYFLVI